MSNPNILKTIAFSDFLLWDVKRFLKGQIESPYPVVRLGDYIIQNSQKFKLYEEPEKEFGILGVNNKTGIFDAYTEKGMNINQPYKKMKTNDLAYNPYRINVGSVGRKNQKHQHTYISPAYVVFSCNENLDSEFLYRMFKTDTFNQVINDNTTGSVRQNLKYDVLENLKIPLPSLTEQTSIVQNYNDKIAKAEEQEKQAFQLEQSIEDYLFEQLGIEKIEQAKKTVGLTMVSFEYLDIWGADKLLRGGINNVLESKKYPNQKLGRVLIVNPTTDLSGLKNDSEMSFIPMKNVSDDYGVVLKKDFGFKEKSKGYTKFKNGDLIWARITPCMQNGKSAIVSELTNGFGYGSTEYHVLRKLNDNFDIEFAYHLLRTNVIRKDAVNYFTGSAGQQRVPKSYLENLLVPIPPVDIQKNISKHISNLKKQIKIFKKQAIANREAAICDFEKEIFSQ